MEVGITGDERVYVGCGQRQRGEERDGEGPANAESVGTDHKGTCYFAW